MYLCVLAVSGSDINTRTLEIFRLLALRKSTKEQRINDSSKASEQ